ncbi:MAG: DUF6597 domain-containing transcriptional factor [Spirochaetota bacterium]
MKIEVFAPSPHLAPYVHYYWIVESESTGYLGGGSHRVIPNGLVELLINFGDDLYCSTSAAPNPRVSLCGQKSGYHDIIQLRRTRLMSVLLKPLGAAVFVPFALKEVADTSVHVDDVFGSRSDSLLDMVAGAKTSMERITVVESFLSGQMHTRYRPEYRLMDGIIQAVTRTCGQITVDDLCSLFDVNAKFLERKFALYVGLRPKMFLRVVRFQHVLRTFMNGRMPLTELAYTCGYYDQPHFIREIREFSGMSPGELFSCEHVYSDYFIN